MHMYSLPGELENVLDLLLLLRSNEEGVNVISDDVLVIVKVLAAGRRLYVLLPASLRILRVVAVDRGLGRDSLLGLGD